MLASTTSRISVALCTYNGEHFLPQQLESIRGQTRLPDEVVICDDGSSDRTLDIVYKFTEVAQFPVKIIRNDTTLGSSRNFEQAVRLCSGDLIALSDQDDIWYPNRLERSEQALASDPRAGLVFSDADIIDDEGRLTGETLWQRLRFIGKPKQDLLDHNFVILAKQRFVTGATVMFRADLRDRFLPMQDGWIHDEWIALISAAFCDLKPIDQPLIRYRIHSLQQVGLKNKLEQRVPKKTRAERHWARLEESVRELQQMCDTLSTMERDDHRGVLPAYHRHLKFLAFRSSLSVNRLGRLGPILKKYAQYQIHASGLASAVKDLVLPRQE